MAYEEVCKQRNKKQKIIRDEENKIGWVSSEKELRNEYLCAISVRIKSIR